MSVFSKFKRKLTFKRSSKTPVLPPDLEFQKKIAAKKLISLWMFVYCKSDSKIPSEITNIIIKFWYIAPKGMNSKYVLLCGTHASGKSTIGKQLRKIYGIFRKDDLTLTAPYIQDAIVSYMKMLCIQSKELALEHNQHTKCQEKNETVCNEIAAITAPYKINNELTKKFKTLWSDEGIQKTWSLRHLYQIHDHVDYFMNDIDRIYDVMYEPSFDDYLRIQTRSTGWMTQIIDVDTLTTGFDKETFTIYEPGGTRSERKKWFKIMDNIHALIYVVALSDFDLLCFEDHATNRLVESVHVFHTLFNQNKHLNEKVAIQILFNKYDVFKTKIKKIPITVAFNDYPLNKNPNDEDEVVKFIANKFLQCFDRQNLKLISPIHIHRTNALDVENMKRLFENIFTDFVKVTQEFLI